VISLYTIILAEFEEVFSLGFLGKLAGWGYTYHHFLYSMLLEK